MGTEFRSLEYGEGDGRAAAALVAGFAGKIVDFETAAMDLVAGGYDVVGYEFDNDVLLAGDAELLPSLITEISNDFAARTLDYADHRTAGVSLGGGVAWNIQKRFEDAEPGVYAAIGADVANLVMNNGAFRFVARTFLKIDPGQEFKNNGWTPSELSNRWGELHRPPQTGFAVVAGGLDYIVRPSEVLPKFREWQRQGIDINVQKERLRGHTGVIKWFNNHIPTMLDMTF